MRHRDIFLAALDVAPADRPAFLDEACRGDAELRKLVEELLANDRADSFLEHPAVGALPEVGDETCAAGADTPEQAEGPPARDESLSFLQPSRTPGGLGRLGHYEVLEVVGRGGMGVVLRAFDEKLHRVVALKVLAPELASSGTARRRFVREAQAAAAVSHDHVVAIHEVDDAGPVPFLVMQMIDGPSLEDKVRRQGPLELREVLRIGMQTAEGLAAAHRQGLVHRDIKPANILLENGVQRVKITDFGLARAVDDASVSQSGVIAGTPLYMSPEQAEGKTIDTRSDLFSLGSVLYTLCTGRPPFRAETTVAVLKRVCEDTPRPIREVNPDVPGWLCDVIGKLHAKDPAQRFQSAAEVAELLRQHLAHLQRPDQAPRPPRVEKPVAKQPRRARRRWPLVAAAALLLVLGVGAVSVWLWQTQTGRIRLEFHDPNVVVALDGPDGECTIEYHSDSIPGQDAGQPPSYGNRFRPGTYALRAFAGDRLIYTEYFALAAGEEKVISIPAASRNAKPDSPQKPRTPEELAKLPSLFDGRKREDVPRSLLTLTGGGDPDRAPAELVAVLGDSGKEPSPRQGHAGPVFTLAVSPDGRTLASGGADHVIRLWDLATGKTARTLERHSDEVHSVAFSPDGKFLASGSADGTAVLWDAATGQEVRTLPGFSRGYSTLTFSPDGQTLAAGGEGGTARLWDVATGKPKEFVAWHAGVVHGVAFSPDGRLLATAGEDRKVQLCKADSGRWLQTFTAGAAVNVVAFTADGKGVVFGGNAPESTLRFCDASTKAELRFPGHTDSIVGLAVQPGGRLAATASLDGTVRLFDLAGGDGRQFVLGPGPFGARAWDVAFTPEGRYLATANDNGTVSILRVPAPPKPYDPGPARPLPDPAELAKRPSPADALRRNDIPLDLLTKAVGGEPDSLPELVAVLGGEQGHRMQVWSVAVSPDGKTLASAGMDRTARLWDLATGKLLRTLTGHGEQVRSVAFSPDGKRLASFGHDRTVKLWNVADGKELRTLAGHSALVERVAFGPDSRTLASAGDDRAVRLWDVAAGQTVRTFTGHTGAVNAVAVSPDGSLLASAAQDGTVRLWDAATGWQLAELTGHKGSVGRVAFHPDGRTLASGGVDGTVRLWDVTTRQLKQVLEGHRGNVLDLSWSPDGRILASCASAERNVRLWDVTATPRCKALAVFPRGGRYVHGLAFAPDGRHLATANPGDGSPNGEVYVLRLAAPGEVFRVPAAPGNKD